MQPTDEVELVRALAKRSADAFRQVFEMYGGRVFRLHYRMTGSVELAHDLTQDTFIRTFEAAETFRGRGPLGAWILRIAANLSREALRDERRRRNLLVQAVSERRLAQPAESSNAELRSTLWAMIQTLPHKHQLVLKMAIVDGLTHDEIAEILQITPGTSRSILSRTREKLRALLDSEKVLPWKTNGSTIS